VLISSTKIFPFHAHLKKPTKGKKTNKPNFKPKLR